MRTNVRAVGLGLLLCAMSSGCGSPAASRLSVSGGNRCPVITSWTVSPLETGTDGGSISVSVTAQDPDPGDTIRIAWSAETGRFTIAGAAVTEFWCESPGEQWLRVRVTDDGAPPCTAEKSFLVTCHAPRAGASR